MLFPVQGFVPLQLVTGDLRIQVLTPDLVRIEQKGPEGFEDRDTFTIVRRPTSFKTVSGAEINLDGYTILVPDGKAQDVMIVARDGTVVYHWDGKPIPHRFFPGPEDSFIDYAFEDSPRIVPPAWGATPPPRGNRLHPQHSGWDIHNDAPDIYVFLKGPQGYEGLRSDFLDVTGHTQMPPLAAFGFWDSRYYEYKQQEALDTIDKYRSEGFPLDFFVVDTDWRVNGSHGYEVNRRDFPDMHAFIRGAHARHVHLMYNDHPEPVSRNALAPVELQYRWKGLTKLLRMGADVWWYDRNWSTHLDEPAPGIAPEVWGDRLYSDITARFRPNRRPLIMSNVQGIDNGIRNYAPHPAFHRTPIWWTGDTTADWSYLLHGVANGVDSGIISLLPYVNEDLGGHIGTPTPELYVRYLEYGALSPITRIHCTKGQDRHPWIFGPQAESIVRNYLKLRYRLLPTIYHAAWRAYTEGVPILRRCDLYWPEYPQAADDTQYLFGDDILVAPITAKADPASGLASRTVWIPPGEWESAWTGEVQEGPKTMEVRATLNEQPIFCRRSGIVLTVPDMSYTTERPWDQVTADVYPSSQGSPATGTLYEDDGESNDYLKQDCRTTALHLDQSGNILSLVVSPPVGGFRRAIRTRAWTIRIHLLRGQSSAGVSLDGKPLKNGEYAVLDPVDQPGMPFQGPGAHPPKAAGPVVEVRIGKGRIEQGHQVAVEITSAAS